MYNPSLQVDLFLEEIKKPLAEGALETTGLAKGIFQASCLRCRILRAN